MNYIVLVTKPNYDLYPGYIRHFKELEEAKNYAQSIRPKFDALGYFVNIFDIKDKDISPFNSCADPELATLPVKEGHQIIQWRYNAGILITHLINNHRHPRGSHEFEFECRATTYCPIKDKNGYSFVK